MALQIEYLETTEDTYDVTNPTNHNFFANDILVHNSEIILRPYQFCNLTEIVVRSTDTFKDLLNKVRLATLLGTFQSTLTHFPYLRKIWQKNTEEERLLGVSMTGIMDHPATSGKYTPQQYLDFTGGKYSTLSGMLDALRNEAVDMNKQVAQDLGINPSTSITCVKPSGCTTLETKIRTEVGDMSMAEIFSEYCDLNIFEQKPGTWITPNKNLNVYDENNDLQKVTKLFVNGMSPVYEIEDEEGNVFKFTGNHKLKTKNGWKRVDELGLDDEIITF